MKMGVVVFPGSNCDRDCMHVLSEVLGAETQYIWHREEEIGDVGCIVVPGGFSYGDYLRAGAVAKLSPVMNAVRRFAESGGPVLGICNGFQALLECGLLPGAMLRNAQLQFVCRDVYIRCGTSRTPFTRSLTPGGLLKLPIAHAEGNYYIDDDGLKALQDQDQIVFQYCSPHGEVNAGANPNGSVHGIAGICNRQGNVLGMMPHPERASETILGGDQGRAIFESVLNTFDIAS